MNTRKLGNSDLMITPIGFDPSAVGGYKQSGWGREMGHEVLEPYTKTKAVVVWL